MNEFGSLLVKVVQVFTSSASQDIEIRSLITRINQELSKLASPHHERRELHGLSHSFV